MQTAGRRGRPNRQPREQQVNSGSGSGSGRGRGRGSNNQPQHPRPSAHYSNNVPPYSAIKPGTSVSIILKADQPTGHQVRGIVADLLTRGDHPRGVKVRLRDGRVGRVQGVVSEVEGQRGEALVGGEGAGLGRDGEGAGAGAGAGGGRGRGRMVGGRVERDVREEDEYLYDESRGTVVDGGLFAALEEADRREREGRGGMGESKTEVVTCPVCGDFEGDEVAVAHHVEGHFGE